MLRRRLQQWACFVNAAGLALVLSLLSAHLVLRKYQAHVAHGRANDNFSFEDQEGDSDDQQHPPFVLDARVAAGVCLSALVSCAVDVGGVAWGGLHVGIYWLVVGFGLKAATGLSQAAIVGASLAALAANLLRCRPEEPRCRSYKAARTAAAAAAAVGAGSAPHQQQQQQQQQPAVAAVQPLVDLDLVLLLTPGLLFGVGVGVVLNDVLPSWLLTALLVLVLGHTANKTARRGLLMWHAEAQAAASQAAAAAILSRPLPRLPPILTIGSGLSLRACSSSGSSDLGGGDGDEGSSHGAFNSLFVDDEPGAPQCTATAPGTGIAAADSQLPHDQQQQQAPESGARVPCAAALLSSGSAAALSSSFLSGSSADSTAQRCQQASSPVCFTETTPVSPLVRRAASAQPAAGFLPALPQQQQEQLGWRQRWRRAQQRLQAQLLQQQLSPGRGVQLMSLCQFPGLKLASLGLLWSGFMGLTALSGSLPLCSWGYIAHLLLFLGVTVCITAVLIRVVLVAPLVGAEQVGSLKSRIRAAMTTSSSSSSASAGWLLAAAAVCGAAGQQLRAAAAAVPAGTAAARRAAGSWLHILTGFGRPQQQQQLQQEQHQEQDAAVVMEAGGAADEGAQQPEALSLFARARLQQQQRQQAGEQVLEPLLTPTLSEDGEQPWRYEEPFPAALPLTSAALLLPTAPGAGSPQAAAAAAADSSNAALVAVAAAAAAVSVSAGIVTALTGAAGSVLVLPVLLDFRVDMQVATATTSMLVFLSSSAAVLSFLLQGRLVGSYALLFGAVSLAGGCVGVAGGCSCLPALARAARRRRSLVVLALAAALGGTGLACGVVGTLKLVSDARNGEWLGLRAVCSLM